MFEQDYIMRVIREMVRALLKLLFHIDTEAPTEELCERLEEKDTLNVLLELVDSGNINEAENKLYDLVYNGNTEALEAALLFYSYLNEKTDFFLAEHDFSRKEIKEGLGDIVSRYGLGSLADVFLMDM